MTESKKEKKAKVGLAIDFGTTGCRVSAWQEGKVTSLSMQSGQTTLPSVLTFDNNLRAIGSRSKLQSSFFDAKRFLGMGASAVEHEAALYPFRCSSPEGAGNGVSTPRSHSPLLTLIDGGQRLRVEEACAALLSRVRDEAQLALGLDIDVSDCVLSVPAAFSLRQRAALLDAAAIAGLKVQRLVTETTALVHTLAMTPSKLRERHVLLAHVGAGHTEMTYVVVEDGVMEVKASVGNSHLGGVDFDRALMRRCMVECKARNDNRDVVLGTRALCRLRLACERAKIELSTASKATIFVESLYDGMDFNLAVGRTEFEEMCMDMFRACVEMADRAITKGSGKKSLINEVVLAGGSLRIPRLQSMLKATVSGSVPPRFATMQAESSVADGAAYKAAILTGTDDASLKDVLLIDAISYPLGLEIAGGGLNIVTSAYMALPSRCEAKLSTFADNQTSFAVRVYEGMQDDTKETKNAHFLGELLVRGIPLGPKGSAEIVVDFDLQPTRDLIVKAACVKSGINGTLAVDLRLPAAVLAELTLAEQRARDRDRAEAARMAAATALEDQLLAMERSPLDVLVELGGSGSSGSGAGDAKAGTVSPQHQAALTEAVTHARNWLERDEGQAATAAELTACSQLLRDIARAILKGDGASTKFEAPKASAGAAGAAADAKPESAEHKGDSKSTV